MTQTMFMSGALDLSSTADELRYRAEIEQYFHIFSERQETLSRKVIKTCQDLTGVTHHELDHIIVYLYFI